jgi:hypothetical protein
LFFEGLPPDGFDMSVLGFCEGNDLLCWLAGDEGLEVYGSCVHTLGVEGESLNAWVCECV